MISGSESCSVTLSCSCNVPVSACKGPFCHLYLKVVLGDRLKKVRDRADNHLVDMELAIFANDGEV
jgi:hypothetical protein